MIQYILLLIIIIVFLIYIILRVKFNFWAIQPVFHTYDIHHWLNPAHVINTNLPKINKYVKPIDVETICIKEISQEERKLFVNFICEINSHKYLKQ